jgi:hypothetical protein
MKNTQNITNYRISRVDRVCSVSSMSYTCLFSSHFFSLLSAGETKSEKYDWGCLWLFR